VEQLVARRAHNPKVAGSSPVPATTKPDFVKKSGFFVHGARIGARVLSIEVGVKCKGKFGEPWLGITSRTALMD
jgi:hypothetical protein